MRRLERELAGELAQPMVDRLRAEGRYAKLRQRAEAKSALLSRLAAVETETDTPGDLRVLTWYFHERLNTAIPDDLEAYARELGVIDADMLRRMLWREFQFVVRGPDR